MSEISTQDGSRIDYKDHLNADPLAFLKA